MSAKTLVRYLDLYLRLAAEVLHPVRAVASTREHVQGACLRHEGEPDLDLVRQACHAARGGQVAKILFGEFAQINHRLQATGIRDAGDTARVGASITAS